MSLSLWEPRRLPYRYSIDQLSGEAVRSYADGTEVREALPHQVAGPRGARLQQLEARIWREFTALEDQTFELEVQSLRRRLRQTY